MAIRLTSHLYRNRCGIFYFRQVIPSDLLRFFYVREIHVSLRTGTRRDAADLVLPFVYRSAMLFSFLRKSVSDDGEPEIPAELAKEIKFARTKLRLQEQV
jgi:cellulose synthase/poly-beta-1,6-N-acetylglucosamine synthase-like glycosyltransferase